jgi:hypothetical protein
MRLYFGVMTFRFSVHNRVVNSNKRHNSHSNKRHNMLKRLYHNMRHNNLLVNKRHNSNSKRLRLGGILHKVSFL